MLELAEVSPNAFDAKDDNRTATITWSEEGAEFVAHNGSGRKIGSGSSVNVLGRMLFDVSKANKVVYATDLSQARAKEVWER